MADDRTPETTPAEEQKVEDLPAPAAEEQDETKGGLLPAVKNLSSTNLSSTNLHSGGANFAFGDGSVRNL